MLGPDFVREFPNVIHEWRIFTPEGFLMYMTLSFVEVAAIMLAYQCVIDTYCRYIELV